VTEEYDRGPLIAQWPVPVLRDDAPETLAARVLAVEHRLLPQVVLALARVGAHAHPVRLFARGATFVTGDDVHVALDAIRPAGLAAQTAAAELAVRFAGWTAVAGFEQAATDSLLALLPGSARDRA